MNTRLIVLVASLYFSLIQAPMAQDVIDGASITTIIDAAREYGSATLASQEDGNPMIAGQINGIPYAARFRNCVTVQSCEDMNFRVGFLIQPSLEVINAWNRRKRFAKAYLDMEGDAILEMDTILIGGITEQNMSEVFSYWRLSIAQFMEHIGFR